MTSELAAALNAVCNMPRLRIVAGTDVAPEQPLNVSPYLLRPPMTYAEALQEQQAAHATRTRENLEGYVF
jgi:hypothetical protein